MNVKKTERDGIVRAYPENGKSLAWSASSGVELIEKDGLYFKDLEKTGELLPYEDWRLPVEERAADLASRLTTEEIAGLMLYSPHQAVPPMAFGPFGGTYNGQKRGSKYPCVYAYRPAEGIHEQRAHSPRPHDYGRRREDCRKVEQ